MAVLDLAAYKPVPATLGDANQIANGFAAIQAVVNALDNNNFGAGKIFDPLKLMQDGASAGQGLVWSAAANGGTGGWVPGNPGPVVIDDVTAGAPLASYDTNARLGGNIPGTFNHLRLLVSGRSTAAVANENTLMQFNADVGADYYDLLIQDTAGTPTGSESLGGTSFPDVGAIVGAGAGLAGESSTIDISIPFYKDTNFYKQFIAQATGLWAGTTGSHFIRLTGGMWINNVAITRIKLFPATGSFATGTRFILYGIM